MSSSAIQDRGWLDIEMDQASDGAVRMRLRGRVDPWTNVRLRDAFHTVLDGPARTVFVDLSEVAFADSCGLATLIAARRRSAGHGAELVLTGVGPRLSRLFAVTGLGRSFRTVAA